jgi:D-alanyl-D-alanine carboxypeptidase
MGRQKLAEFPTLRGKRGIAVVFLGALAFAATASSPADARRSHPGHAANSDGAKREAHAEKYEVRSESSRPPHAEIVVDANGGKVLHADNPDELRHPASLTKIMTLYLLFERLDAGTLKLDSELNVSEHAAGQSPTKLGLKPGQTLAVEDAIRGLVTKSANDAAVVIAEAIGGSEHDFAEMMTRKAHALGMSRTDYHNASGLPNDEQVTTARDQALLGRAVQERFPQYYRYFSTPSFTYHGVAMRNHNHLLGHVEGLDGIKTGYTQASGFNLVTSVRRDHRHIVAVVLGGTSAGSRDARMRDLIEEYIGTAVAQTEDGAAAQIASAKETRRPEQPRTETRPVQASNVQPSQPDQKATYAVASFSSRPLQYAGTATFDGSRRLALPPADPSTATGSVPAAKATSIISDPITPIQVKTVKVRLPPAQVAALASPRGVSATPVAETTQNDAAPSGPELRPVRAPVAGFEAIAPPAPGLDQKAIQDRFPTAPKAAARSDKPVPGPTTTADRSAVDTPAVLEKAPSPPQAAKNAAPPHAANAEAKPEGATAHSGWIIQVGAFEAEREAKQKLSAVQTQVAPILGRADPFTEPVVKGDKTFYRARFAGLQKNEAEAVCRQLKRKDIDCMTIKN